MRVRTGVGGFDPIVGGGLPQGASVILQGPSGTEKDLFGLQFLAEGLKSGEAVVIVISSQSPDRYVESLAKLGVNVKEAIAGNLIKIVDWHSYKEGSVAGVEELEHVIRCSVDLTNVGIALSRALGTLPPGVRRRAVLEVLSPALQVRHQVIAPGNRRILLPVAGMEIAGFLRQRLQLGPIHHPVEAGGAIRVIVPDHDARRLCIRHSPVAG